MHACDAIIVGGGPAGSACAWKLVAAGLDVVVVDRAAFPRDKTCAGWITPQVITELAIDPDDYRAGRTFQPISAFRVGVIGRSWIVDTRYERPVSYGIRRCEFDHYLLQRSRATLRLSTSVTSLRYAGGRWTLNEELTAPLIVGAGGHFCPVARHLNGGAKAAAVVVAQEAEFDARAAGDGFTTRGDAPELYFCDDLQGYGWCFRKQAHINVGFGRLDARSLPKATAAFVSFLKARGTVPAGASFRWVGHAYAVYGGVGLRRAGPGVLLVGDAAALAYPQSGEGIRPAIESGLLAAATILDVRGDYAGERLSAYESRIAKRFGATHAPRRMPRVAQALLAAAGSRFLRVPAFARHVVLDRWFLHANEPALA